MAGFAGAQLWDPAGRRVIRELRGRMERVTADARGLVAAVLTGGELRLWDLRTGRERRVGTRFLEDAQISRNGRAVVVAGFEDGHHVDAFTGRLGAAFPYTRTRARCARFAPRA